jgi:hypothetical protein
MTDALTGTPWLAVLDRIVRHTDDEMKRTLARMLYEILSETNDSRVGEIADAYAWKLLGSLT